MDGTGIPGRTGRPGFAPAERGRGGRAAWVYAVGIPLYLALAGLIVWTTRHRINPDAIAYIQNARHYAAGRLDLAVNGWFGPMLSWLTVPAVWGGLDPVVWIRALNAVAGVAFAFAAARLAGRMAGSTELPARAGGRWQRLVFACALLLALMAVGEEITPDFLLTCALGWYFLAAHGLLRAGGARRAFAVGLLGGACYYLKGYALVFVAVHLPMTLLLRWRLSRRGLAPGGAMRALPAAWAGLAVAALPWVAIISLQAHRPSITTMGRSAQCWGPLPVRQPLPVHMLQRPRQGRITSWENPAEIPYPWPRWPAEGTVGFLSAAARATALNLLQAARSLAHADLLALLAVGWLAACGLCLVPGQRLTGPAPAGRAWARLTVALYVAGLAPLWVVGRYLWPAWSLLLAVAASLLSAIEARMGRPRSPGLPAELQTRREGARRLVGLLAAILALSIAARVELRAFLDPEGPVRAGRRASWLRDAARRAAPPGPVASNDWYGGLFAAYWSGRPFLGQLTGGDPWAMADELAPYGKTTVMHFCRWSWWWRFRWESMGWNAPMREYPNPGAGGGLLEHVPAWLGGNPWHVGAAWDNLLVFELDPAAMPPRQEGPYPAPFFPEP